MKILDFPNLAIAETDLESKINIAELYAKLVVKYPIYEAIDFENRLIEDFSHVLVNFNKRETNRNICHVITTPYLTGGHTRLCEKLSMMENEDSSLLVTGTYEEEVIHRLSSFFSKIKCINEKSLILSIIKMMDFMSAYSKLVLHIHPDDIKTVIAVGLLRKVNPEIKVLFVNHADHLFSYGRSVIDIMLDISYRGYCIDSSLENKKYVNSFLGIPVEVNKRPVFNDNIKNIIIAGSSYKMKPNKRTSIQREINKLFSLNKEYNLNVIGAKATDYWWWPLKIKFPSRIKISKSLPYNKYMDMVKKCDTCIDTSPIGGGTAFVEMYLNSLRPVAIYADACGYTPLDAVRKNTLLESINSHQSSSSSLFNAVLRVHKSSFVKERYLSALNMKCHSIDPSLVTSRNDMNLFIKQGKFDYNFSDFGKLMSIKSLSGVVKLKFIIQNYSFVKLPFKLGIKLSKAFINK
ncbi:hypothetical protein NL53_05085 [Vibrio variabilis]|uniref:Glycosyltransferase n=1 Tax=Vibrio variabilis TaxID=990271 RepID=A0ABR4YFH6_9VIBR|nr:MULTISPECIES: hypothetical protein [Vibrio]KHA61690.1 hypothetical protein NL53_05085 [Vibrio variabilis]KHT43149.1 hypothetical protein RJ47_12650 [Vibrio sinaloensis]